MHAAQDLCAQGQMASMRNLAKATGLTYFHARVFLKLHSHELPQEYIAGSPEERVRRERERTERIARSYEQLVAQGALINMTRLAKAAHVGMNDAKAFLHRLEEIK